MSVHFKKFLFYLFALLAGSVTCGVQLQTFFDECIKTLENDNHHLFSVDDAAKLKGDMRYQRFCHEYKRYVVLQESVLHDVPIKSYGRDDASAVMCNAFVRWVALKSVGDDISACSQSQLFSAIIHTNYLLRSFVPQNLRKNGFSPDIDLNKMSELMKLQFDVQQELAHREAARPDFALKVVTQPQSATWLFGDVYENISSVQWDASGQYLICLATKAGIQSVLIFSYRASQLQLTKEVEIAIAVDEIPDFKATYVVWGASFQTFILGGNARNRKKAAALLYTYNAAGKTAQRNSMIHQIPSSAGISHHAFWSADFSRLCVVHAGECFVFVWHAEDMRFELERRIYPGLKHVNTASLSFDLSCFLTSHSEYPYIRITKKDAPFGAFSVAHFKDRLLDAQWNPQYFYFAARSFVESGVVILFAYNPETEKVLMIQRIQVGSAIASMKWSADGAYLFVECEPSLYSGVGLRSYSFVDGVLSVADSIDESSGEVCRVKEFAYSDVQKTLVIAGVAQDNFNGSVLYFPPKNVRSMPLKEPARTPVVPPALSIQVRSLDEKDMVYTYLGDVPSVRTVGFGSLVMLANPLKPSMVLSSCDAPEIRLVHNGKAFACAREQRAGDFSGEYLSAWWLVEGESWIERLNAPVKPVARMRLRNLATGEYLGISRESAPVYGVSCDPHVALKDSADCYLTIKRPQDEVSPWLIGEGVHLVSDGFAVGVDTVQPTNHPILANLGISKLIVEPMSSLEVRGGLAPAFWAVSRNIPLTTVLAQSEVGSECCGLLHKRLSEVVGKEELQQIERKIMQSVC